MKSFRAPVFVLLAGILWGSMGLFVRQLNAAQRPGRNKSRKKKGHFSVIGEMAFFVLDPVPAVHVQQLFRRHRKTPRSRSTRSSSRAWSAASVPRMEPSVLQSAYKMDRHPA